MKIISSLSKLPIHNIHKPQLRTQTRIKTPFKSNKHSHDTTIIFIDNKHEHSYASNKQNHIMNHQRTWTAQKPITSPHWCRTRKTATLHRLFATIYTVWPINTAQPRIYSPPPPCIISFIYSQTARETTSNYLYVPGPGPLGPMCCGWAGVVS